MSSREPVTELPFLLNVGLMMTLRCQVACPHCIVQAGPRRTEELAIADARRWLGELAAYRRGHIRFLSLTGGEPFYNLELLREVSTLAERLGLVVSAVTNAYWARDREAAIATLRSIPAVRMLAISTDLHHLPLIPLDRVRFAVEAAQACGIPYNVHVCTEDENAVEYRRLRQELAAFTPPESINEAVTMPAGRALSAVGLDRYAMADAPPHAACGAGNSPLIFSDGRVFACVGPVIDVPGDHPLLLGRLGSESLATILDRAELNPVLHAIRVWGPHRLIELIRGRWPDVPLPTRYIKDSVCHACYQLMEHASTVARLAELAADEAFREKVAYARCYYLGETRMAQMLGLLDRNPAPASAPEPEFASAHSAPTTATTMRTTMDGAAFVGEP